MGLGTSTVDVCHTYRNPTVDDRRNPAQPNVPNTLGILELWGSGMVYMGPCGICVIHRMSSFWNPQGFPGLPPTPPRLGGRALAGRHLAPSDQQLFTPRSRVPTIILGNPLKGSFKRENGPCKGSISHISKVPLTRPLHRVSQGISGL